MSDATRFAAVVGTFDGMHRGHNYLLDALKGRASQLGLATRVYTFTDHPLATLCSGKAPLMLNSLIEKMRRLESSGVDEYNIVDFCDIASMTARQYIEALGSNGVELIVIGYDNRFGSDRLVTLDQFREAARGTGVCIEQASELMTDDGSHLNSSAIRELLLSGDAERANLLLGYEYEISGMVVKGKQLGRTIGFPTANLDVACKRKLIPRNGVYACRAIIDGNELPAMVNVGHRPTVDVAGAPVSIEAHLIGGRGDMYGKSMTLKVVSRLRDEQRFDSIDQLKARLELDLRATLRLL